MQCSCTHTRNTSIDSSPSKALACVENCNSCDVSLRRRCRSLDATRSSRCRRRCRWSWPRAECRECWAHTSCQKAGSCTSHRLERTCSWACTADECPPWWCWPPCWSSSVFDDSPSPSLLQRIRPIVIVTHSRGSCCNDMLKWRRGKSVKKAEIRPPFLRWNPLTDLNQNWHVWIHHGRHPAC